MERFALDALRAWKNRRGRKPLVMRGARQVGKTWLVRKRAEPFGQIEVKSGATGRLKSMHQFLAEKKSDFGLRFNGSTPSYVETDFPDCSGARHPFRLLSLPLYLASEARRLAEERL